MNNIGQAEEAKGEPLRQTPTSEGEQSSRAAGHSRQGLGGASRASRIPPDDRTDEEKEEDERAEEQYWQDRLKEGYEAARDSVASDDSCSRLSWGLKLWRRLALRWRALR
ncbi:hypothetical protein [Paraburkholderia sp. BL21I4N1]|uniref:hypothetical protein n=1 Tax=Paraburkholderia sp. BL21I4N1 TaxID=1938801 RepID=UPI000D4D3A86|nr:hypothetical protein [Paraburkholderia sp. BL21I4N1]PQV48582.1 hypothetical protein B0G83_108109 [Paraburkholderia sp. BL21I4N1]